MYEQIENNLWKTAFLFIAFSALILVIGWFFSITTPYGGFIIPFAILFSVAGCVGSYYFSDQILLAVSQAKPADREEHLALINSVEGLAIASGLPAPRIYVIDDTAPNAFASGRNPQHAFIAVTTGLLQKLNRLELEGVLAHEMSHIKNYDTLFSTLAIILVGCVALLADWWWRSARFTGRKELKDWRLGLLYYLGGFVLMMLTPLAAQLLQLALSRRREYLADVSGAMLTRYPAGLADALQKIHNDTEPLEVANKATAALYIVNPLLDHRGPVNSLFNTHPPTLERIKILREMAHDRETNLASPA